MVSVSGPNGAIDIEPALDVAADGTTYLVWLNDSYPDHHDLTVSNQGRNLHFSKWTGAARSPPQAILGALTKLPGILEPSIALEDPKNGVAAFTVLPLNANPKDMGLQNTRMLYAASSALRSPIVCSHSTGSAVSCGRRRASRSWR